MDYLKTAIGITRSPKFYTTEKFAFFMGVIAPLSNMLFYLICKFYLGYHEDLLLRLIIVAITIPFVFFPKNSPFQTWHKVYWEAALVFMFPFVFANLMMHNNMNQYWYASLMWAGFVYGFTSSKVYFSVVAFPLGLICAAASYLIQTGSAVSTLSNMVGAFAIAWLSSMVIAMIKLALDIFYVISLDTTKERLRAEDALRRQLVLEHKNSELVARNAIISTFVRPSVVNEVNQGRDPRQFKPRMSDKAILICDMRNFTPLTESMTDPDVQAQFLNKYFEMMIDPVFSAGGEVDKLMGDAVMAIFPDGKTAVEAALLMRQSLQIYNKQLVIAGMPKMANVIAIAKGSVLEANIGSEKKYDRTWIGTAVNVCSRLESVAKLYGLEIVVSQEVMDDLQDDQHSRMVDILRVKGYHKKFEVFEIYGHQAREVVAYKDETRDSIRQGIYAYFNEGTMANASRLFEQLLEKMPSHKHKPGKLMDAIVYLYAHRCRQVLNNPDVVPRGLDMVEGCHDFSSDLMPRDWYNIEHPAALARLRQISETSSVEATARYASARRVEPEDN